MFHKTIVSHIHRIYQGLYLKMCFPWERKKIKHYKPLGEECAICLGAMVNEASRCPGCEMGMHRMCLTRWKYACKKREVDFTCPLCRYVFKEHM